MMRLESSKDMGDPREISCKSGTIDLKETQTQTFEKISIRLCEQAEIYCTWIQANGSLKTCSLSTGQLRPTAKVPC